MKKYFLIGVFLFVFLAFVPSNARQPLSHQPTIAGMRHYFAPLDNLAQIDYAILDSAKHRIDFAAYVLTDRGIMNSLIDAARRGVRIRLFLDPNQRAIRNFERSSQFATLLDQRGIQVRVKQSGRDLMHLKAYQVDGRLLRTGAANFSYSGLRRQDNDLLLIESKQLAGQFVQKFNRLWIRAGSKTLTFAQ